MRIRQWMVALTLACTACASTPAPIPTPTPQAPPEPTTAQLSLSGLPDITLPHSPRTAALREALALVEATRAHEPGGEASEAWRLWGNAGARATLRVERIAASLGDSAEGQVAQVLRTLLREQLIYREALCLRFSSEAQRADRDRALEACVAVGESDARLAPWTQRCGALIAYWRADAAWRAGPHWPEGCSDDAPMESMNRTATGRRALALRIHSDLSPRDEARLAATVQRVLLASYQDAYAIPEREQRAAEDSFVAMRGVDGQQCASPPHADERLVRTHPGLVSFWVEAQCRRQHGTRRCVLTVHFAPGARLWFETLEAPVEGQRPTVADFEEAASHLHERQSEEYASRCALRSDHLAPENMCGESASLEDSDIDAALGPIRSAVQACRDTDLAPASHFRVRLDVAGDGRVHEVDIDHVPGQRRVACLTRAFRNARFPAAQMPAVVTVNGWFEANTTQSVPMRARVEGEDSNWSDARIFERLQACVDADSPVHVVDGTLHIAANGIASRVDGDATDATSVCIRNALVGSAWSCAGERDVPMRLCIGNPVRATEPVRP